VCEAREKFSGKVKRRSLFLRMATFISFLLLKRRHTAKFYNDIVKSITAPCYVNIQGLKRQSALKRYVEIKFQFLRRLQAEAAEREEAI
jgi:hypothetical protein